MSVGVHYIAFWLYLRKTLTWRWRTVWDLGLWRVGGGAALEDEKPGALEVLWRVRGGESSRKGQKREGSRGGQKPQHPGFPRGPPPWY